MATPSNITGLPQLLPPMEEFLSSETDMGSLLLHDTIALYIFLECILVVEKGCGDHSVSPTGYPYHRTKNLVIGVWFLNSITTAKSFQIQSMLVYLRPQAPTHEEHIAQGFFFIVLIVIYGTWDRVTTSQGVSVCMLESQSIPKPCKGRKIPLQLMRNALQSQVLGPQQY